MTWCQRVRATVGPEWFDRIVAFVVRNRRRIEWLATVLVVVGPPALAIYVRLFSLLPAGPFPAPVVEHPMLLGQVVPAVLIWIGLLWVVRAVVSALVS